MLYVMGGILDIDGDPVGGVLDTDGVLVFGLVGRIADVARKMAKNAHWKNGDFRHAGASRAWNAPARENWSRDLRRV
jgi:hypothetical protein